MLFLGIVFSSPDLLGGRWPIYALAAAGGSAGDGLEPPAKRSGFQSSARIGEPGSCAIVLICFHAPARIELDAAIFPFSPASIPIAHLALLPALPARLQAQQESAKAGFLGVVHKNNIRFLFYK
jgi:hypothetical protein